MNDAETEELGTILRAIRDTGHTVLVVEHNMSLVMGVSDHVVVMDHGKVIANDTVPGLQARVPLVAGQRASLEAVFLTLTGRSLRD